MIDTPHRDALGVSCFFLGEPLQGLSGQVVVLTLILMGFLLYKHRDRAGEFLRSFASFEGSPRSPAALPGASISLDFTRGRVLRLTSRLHAGLIAVELCFELWVRAATKGPPVWFFGGCALVCFAVGRSRRSVLPPREQEVHVQGVGGRSERSIHHVLRRRGRRLDRHGR
jgi:hypothetical protein